ncbi:MAG TPA: RdgB/HAM1 family non-canonical purine NTP pyrophosphatase, partial [Kiloniellales bacterium]
MNRRPSGGKLVLASHNPGKAREIAELLAPHGLSVLSAASLGLPEPEESGATFTENAILKGLAAARASGLPALADDSGLAVAALGGQPGIHSARWAGPRRDFSVAMARVERELTRLGGSDRRATFVSVLCLAWPDGRHETFEGRIDGTLEWPPRGTNGFGYDPIFVPEGARQTFGEIAPAAKLAVDHRSRAFA